MRAIETIKQATRDVQNEMQLIAFLEKRAWDDAHYMATRENVAIKRSVQASFDATHRAIDAIKLGEIDKLKDDMGAGIIALNEACRLLDIPPHERTAIAVDTWGEARRGTDAAIAASKRKG